MGETNLTPIYQEYSIDMSSNNNFVQVPSVQGDGNFVRYVRIMLIANNTQYIIPENVGVYIIGTKPDTKHIFNTCEIDEDGRVLVEITSQMSAVDGKGDYQIMFVDTQNNSQLKSFPFYLITTKSYDASAITSSDEYQALTEALAQMQADYEHYVTECAASADAAALSEANAATSEANTLASENAAKASEDAAKASEDAAALSEQNAAISEANAATSEQNAATSESNAATSESNAEAWAVGQRGGVDVGSSDVTYENNSKYWAERAADWSKHDASHLTYTLQDGTEVNLASFLKIIEDLDNETLLLI